MTVSDDEKYQAPEDVWPKRGSSDSRSEVLYSVEARLAYFTPKQINGHLLDTRWTTVRFDPAPMNLGVPNSRRCHSASAIESGFFGYEAAMALMWWFRANAALTYDDICLETRLVAQRVKTEFSAEAIGSYDAVTSRAPALATPTPASL